MPQSDEGGVTALAVTEGEIHNIYHFAPRVFVESGGHKTLPYNYDLEGLQ
jgi:hypothetical protein